MGPGTPGGLAADVKPQIYRQMYGFRVISTSARGLIARRAGEMSHFGIKLLHMNHCPHDWSTRAVRKVSSPVAVLLALTMAGLFGTALLVLEVASTCHEYLFQKEPYTFLTSLPEFIN